MRDRYAQPNMDQRRQVALRRAQEIGEGVRPQAYDRFDPEQAGRGRRRVRSAIVVMVAMVIGLFWVLGVMLGFW